MMRALGAVGDLFLRSPTLRVVWAAIKRSFGYGDDNMSDTPPWEGHHKFRDEMYAELREFLIRTVGVNLVGDEEGENQLDAMTDAMLESFDFIVVTGKSPVPKTRREESEAELTAEVVAELEAAGVEGDITKHLAHIIRNSSDIAARSFAWQLQQRPRISHQEKRLATLRDSLHQVSELLFGKNLDLDSWQHEAYPSLPSMKGRRGEMSAEGTELPMIPILGQIAVFPEHPDFIPCDGRKVFAEDWPELHELFQQHKPDQVEEVAGKTMLVMPDLSDKVMRDEDEFAATESPHKTLEEVERDQQDRKD